MSDPVETPEPCPATYKGVPCSQEAGHDGDWHTDVNGTPFHNDERD